MDMLKTTYVEISSIWNVLHCLFVEIANKHIKKTQTDSEDG